MSYPSLVPYSIKLREKGTRESFFDLCNLSSDKVERWHGDGGYSSPPRNFVELLGRYLRRWKGNGFVDHDSKKSLGVSDFEVSPAKGVAEGVFRRGAFGHRSDFFSLENGIRVEDVRTSSDAVETPFYFHLRITEREPTRALLFLERRGRLGIKTVLQEAICDLLPSSLIVEMQPISGDTKDPVPLTQIIDDVRSTTANSPQESHENSHWPCLTISGSDGTGFESLYENSVNPYRYLELRRPYLLWQVVLLIQAAITDTGQFSSELGESQKMMVRTLLAVTAGTTAGVTLNEDLGTAVGIGAWATSLLETFYRIQSEYE